MMCKIVNNIHEAEIGDILLIQRKCHAMYLYKDLPIGEYSDFSKKNLRILENNELEKVLILDMKYIIDRNNKQKLYYKILIKNLIGWIFVDSFSEFKK